MLDLSYFQNSGNVNTQTFTNAGSWITWVKPRGAKFVNIFCMGSGAGGGGGFQVNSATRTGGAGGGSGGVVNIQFQASILPDTLYVYTGVGGAGGTGGAAGIVTAGGGGEKSYICLIPSTASASNIVVTSGNVAAIGGQSGSAATAVGRNGETQVTAANAIFLNLGTFIANPGTIGASSNTSTTSTINFINFPGAGGGNISGGTNVAVAGPFPATTPTAQGGSGATNAGNGKDGYMITKPILGFMGGNGGGGIASGGTGNAGNGGNGNYGSGGGGGGSAQTGIAGNGGRGGDGLVIITTSF
jgi:hypothetical protein